MDGAGRKGGGNVKRHKVRTLRDFMKYTRRKNGCLLWAGFLYPRTGYGQCYFGEPRGHWHGAHRVRWILEYGSIPQGMWVLHKCDTPECVALDHLFLGTARDNSEDMKSKGRGCRGERNPHASTTEDVVKAVRAAYAIEPKKYGSVTVLARRFGLTFKATYQIVTGASWRHVRP